MDEQPTISEDLRTALCQVWTLGFLDAMRASIPPHVEDDTPLGSEVYPLYDPEHPPGTPPAHPPYDPDTDSEALPPEIALPLATLAAGCIDRAASLIAEVFTENPSTVWKVVYRVGFDAWGAMNAANGAIEVHLN